MDATSKQPEFSVYNATKKSPHTIFYGSEIKKDSELQFSNRDVQRLLLDRAVGEPSPPNDSSSYMIKTHHQTDSSQSLDTSYLDRNHAVGTPLSEQSYSNQSQPVVTSSESLDTHGSYMDQLHGGGSSGGGNSEQSSNVRFKPSQSQRPHESNHSTGNGETLHLTSGGGDTLHPAVTSGSDTVYAPHTIMSSSLDGQSQSSRGSGGEGSQVASQSSMMVKSHVCLTCYKTFRNKPQLTQHELVHNGMRKHVCAYCDKAFKQVCHLNQHIRVHTGERPYKCAMEGCGRSFAQLSNLNHHQKNHEEHVRRDVSRQFRCEVCDRSYANQTSLQTHIQKLHTNVKGVEGTPSRPIVMASQPTRKRKRKIKNVEQTSSDNGRCETFTINLTDSDDDGLPTQVKTANPIRTKTSYTLKLHMDNGEKHGGSSSNRVDSNAYSQDQDSPMMEQFEDRLLSQTNAGLITSEDSLILGRGQQGLKLDHVQMPTFLSSALLQQHPTLQQTVKNLQQRETTAASSSSSRTIFCPPLTQIVHQSHQQTSLPSPPITSLTHLQAQSLHLPVSETQATHISHHFPESSNLGGKEQRHVNEQRFGQLRFRSDDELGAERITAERLLVDARIGTGSATDPRFHDERILAERLLGNNQRSAAEQRQSMVEREGLSEQRLEHRGSTEHQQQQQQHQQQQHQQHRRSVDQKRLGDESHCVDHRDLVPSSEQRAAAEQRQRAGQRHGAGQQRQEVGHRQGAEYAVFNPAFTEHKNRLEQSLFGQKQT